jgi:hypothetical protein
MVKKNSQLKDKELERLIDKDIREMRMVIKDKDRQRDVEEKIRRDMEYENSFEGVLNHLRIWGEAATEDEKNKGINERKADDQAEKWGFKRCYKDYNF